MSIVLPTYNRAHVVLDAVDSVLAQTFGDFELLVVDDNSTDATLEVLNSIADPRVRILGNSRTKGVSGARNTGISAAAGEWLCQIDSDDLWDGRFLELICAGIDRADESVGIVYGSLAFVVDGRIATMKRAEASGHTFPKMLYAHFFYHTASAFRISLVRDIGCYDEALSDSEDTDLQLRLTERCAMLPVPEALYYYRRDGNDRITRGFAAAAISMNRYLDKHADLFASHPLAKLRAVNGVLTAAIQGGAWGLVLRMWSSLLAAALRKPKLAARYQLAAARLVSTRLLGRGRPSGG